MYPVYPTKRIKVTHITPDDVEAMKIRISQIIITPPEGNKNTDNLSNYL
jgi:hypothetical protein